jgi:hypothetical protein
MRCEPARTTVGGVILTIGTEPSWVAMPEDFALLWLVSAVAGSLADAGVGDGVVQAPNSMAATIRKMVAPVSAARSKLARL